MFTKKHTVINFGPQHPAAHGVLRLILEMDGETVVSADPHIGFLHRGTEKLIENKTYKQSVPYFDRLDYVSMLSQEHGFVLAVEYLLNMQPSEKAKAIRVLFDELTRLMNHIMCITTHALDVGALTPFLWGFEEREKLMSFYEELSGARMHAAYYVFGGVSFDVPNSLLDKIYAFSNNYLEYIKILDDLLSNNPIWVSRLKGVGTITKTEAMDYAFSGPVIRGSGIPWDIRKTQPYEVYKDLDFLIPVGMGGDSYSRYYVRLMEMRESIKIVQSTVNFISLNNSQPVNWNMYKSKIKKTQNKSRNMFKSAMEELIISFQENALGSKVPKGNVSCFIEAPKGETGVHLFSDGSNKPYRCKIKAPGFMHLQGLNLISKDMLIADVVTNIGSLDIVFGEIDR